MNSNKNSSSKNKCCQSSAAGYASPMAAFRNGPREQLLFVTCPSVDSTQPDLLATICVDPESPEYCKVDTLNMQIFKVCIFWQVISSLEMPNCGDEIHHTGWNICSSCHGQPGARTRSHLMLPCLNSSRIYAVDLTDPRAPRLEKVNSLFFYA
jgi:methanethiol oxidase